MLFKKVNYTTPLQFKICVDLNTQTKADLLMSGCDISCISHFTSAFLNFITCISLCVLIQFRQTGNLRALGEIHKHHQFRTQ